MSSRAEGVLVSVALCTHNGAKYLREQVQSVLAQTYKNLELIAVDDCSKDDSLSILEQFAATDRRVRVFQNQTNLGVSKNFEQAMRRCTGEFVALCDQDDIWDVNKLSLLIAAMGDASLVYCDSELIDERGQSLGVSMSDKFQMGSIYDPAAFAGANCVSGHAMVFRKDLLALALPVPAVFFHDWWIAAVAASRGGAVYVDRKLVAYRTHGENVTDVLQTRRKDRERGHRAKRLTELRDRVEHLQKLPGPSRPMLMRLSELLALRERQWISLPLGVLVFRHADTLFALRKKAPRKLSLLRKYAAGMRLKRLLAPYAYS